MGRPRKFCIIDVERWGRYVIPLTAFIYVELTKKPGTIFTNDLTNNYAKLIVDNNGRSSPYEVTTKTQAGATYIQLSSETTYINEIQLTGSAQLSFVGNVSRLISFPLFSF